MRQRFISARAVVHCVRPLQKEVLALYGNEPIPFPHFKRNRHNSRWKLGDWWERLSLRFDTWHAKVSCSFVRLFVLQDG